VFEMASRRSATHVAACLALLGLTAPRAARADDRSAAVAILLTLEHGPSALGAVKSPGSASPLAPTDDAVTRAHDALERATRMRNAGDEGHARVAEGLALEWAAAAQDRARTTAAETKARDAELSLVDANARVERERSLLEEAIARRGRLTAELAHLTTKGGNEKAREHTSASAATLAPEPTPKVGQSRPKRDAPEAGEHRAPPRQSGEDAPPSDAR